MKYSILAALALTFSFAAHADDFIFDWSAPTQLVTNVAIPTGYTFTGYEVSSSPGPGGTKVLAVTVPPTQLSAADRGYAAGTVKCYSVVLTYTIKAPTTAAPATLRSAPSNELCFTAAPEVAPVAVKAPVIVKRAP